MITTIGCISASYASNQCENINRRFAQQTNNIRPIQLIKESSDHLISSLNKLKNSELQNSTKLYQVVRTNVLPYVDLNRLAANVVGITWRSSSSAEKEKFKKLFVHNVTRTYADALASGKKHDVTIAFLPIRGFNNSQQDVTVNSKICQIGNPNSVNVEYRLVQEGKQWKIVDMIIEGISLTSSFKNQFQATLAQGGLKLLNERLTQHNNR